MKDRPDKGQSKWLRIDVYKGTMRGHTAQMQNLDRMRGDLLYFASKHRAPLVPTPAQLYMMKAIMEQYEKTGEVKVVVKKR